MEVAYTNARYRGKDKKIIEVSNLNIDGIDYGFVRADVESSVVGKMFQDYVTRNNIELAVLPDYSDYGNALTDDEMLKNAIVRAVQNQIDATAAGKGYDNANSCISYYNSADPVFSKEAKVMLDWRDRCWRYCYNLLDEYQAGKIERPSVEFVLESLPKIEWDND